MTCRSKLKWHGYFSNCVVISLCFCYISFPVKPFTNAKPWTFKAPFTGHFISKLQWYVNQPTFNDKMLPHSYSSVSEEIEHCFSATHWTFYVESAMKHMKQRYIILQKPSMFLQQLLPLDFFIFPNKQLFLWLLYGQNSEIMASACQQWLKSTCHTLTLILRSYTGIG